MHHYIYIILKGTEMDIVNWNDVVENSPETVRWNQDKSKFFVKFIGDCPSWGVNKPLYTKKQLNILLLNNSW